MSELRNYYDELGITRNATVEEVISAVKQLVKINNPENFTNNSDRTKAQDKLKTIKTAYETLKDSTKRFEYDLLLDEQENVGSSKKSESPNKKKSNFKLFTGLFLGTVAVTAGSTTYLTKLDCSNIRNIVDSTVCEKTKPIREIFGSTDVAPPVVVTAELANQTPSEKPIETAPAVTNEPVPVSKEPDVKNAEPVNVQVNVATDNSVNTTTSVAQIAPVQESVSMPSTVGSSNECYDLWYQRNLAYAQKGYCFESNLGKRVFSGFKCSQTPESLSSEEKSKINQIKQKESSLNCHLNTDSTEVPSSASTASQTQIQPAVTFQPAQPVVQQPINTGSAPPIQTVIVEGVGTTPQDAAQNAAQNALTNVVGTFIDANTMLQKRTLISDGIKSETKNISKDIKEYSQGSIKSFEILETKQESGLFRVNAKVTVRNENFSAYIKQIAQGEVKVGNDLYVKMATGIKQKDNLTAILKDNVILPIFSGEVQDIEAEKPMLLSDAIGEKKLPAWLVENFQNRTNSNSLIFKVNTGLKKDFLMNLNKTLLDISSSHKNLDANDASAFLENEGFKISAVNNSIFLLKQIAKNPNIVELFEFQNLKVNIAELFGSRNFKFSGNSFTKESDVNLKITISDNSNSPLRIYSLDGSNKFRIYFEKGLEGENKFPWLLINTKSVIGYMARNTFFNVIEEHRSFYVVLEVDPEIMKEMDKITVTLDK